MNALSRLLFAVTAVALSVASCGQKGPLVLPEDESSVATSVATSAATPVAVRLARGRAACGTFPRV